MATGALESVLRHGEPAAFVEVEACPCDVPLDRYRGDGRGSLLRDRLRAAGQACQAGARCIERHPFLALGATCLAGVLAVAEIRRLRGRQRARAAFDNA